MHAIAIALISIIAARMTPETYVDAGDGVRIWYSDSPANGSPIIVVHGGPGMDHLTLEADLAPLAQHHRVIYYDQRGGGRSTLPSDPSLLTIDHHVRDLEALRRHLGLDKVTLLAHSFGPAIAALYAIRYPDHVDRMIFLGPIPPKKGKFFEEFGKTLQGRVSDDQLKRANELQKTFATTNEVAKVCREYWSIMTPPRLAKGASVSVVKSDMCGGPDDAIRFGWTKTNPATFNSLGNWDWTKQLARVKVPTLIIHGQEDAIPMSMVSVWVSALPDARIVRVANAAHFPHAEQPKIVFADIETFLGGKWPADAATK
jgi:proline iminopeptidase